MTTLVHLSDLHFGTEVPAVVTALQRRLEHIRPDMIIISGDLTQRARKREFDAAARFVKSLADSLHCEVMIVPGNHDIPLFNPFARALWPFRRYKKSFGPTDMAVQKIGNLQVICLNSVRRERHASGRITSAQRAKVAQIVAESEPHLLHLVVAHHPLSTTPLAGNQVSQPQDRHTLQSWRKAGVDLILSGHVHRPFLMQAPASGNSETSVRPLWILNAGTAFSKRVRHDFPNSFNTIHHPQSHKEQLVIQRQDYDPSAAGFQAHPEQIVTLPARTIN